MKHIWYMSIGTDSNATGIILGTDQDSDELGETTDEIELIDDTNLPEDSSVSQSVDFQIILLLVLGIIIGILLIGDRRF